MRLFVLDVEAHGDLPFYLPYISFYLCGQGGPNWWGARRSPAERPVLRQPACKPSSVRRKANNTRFARDGHSSGTPVARRLEQPTRAADPDIDPGIAPRAAPIRS